MSDTGRRKRRNQSQKKIKWLSQEKKREKSESKGQCKLGDSACIRGSQVQDHPRLHGSLRPTRARESFLKQESYIPHIHICTKSYIHIYTYIYVHYNIHICMCVYICVYLKVTLDFSKTMLAITR